MAPRSETKQRHDGYRDVATRWRFSHGPDAGHRAFGQTPRGRSNFDLPDEAVMYWEQWPKRFRIEIGGCTVADSRDVMALHEAGHPMRLYIPRGDVAMEALTRAEKSTHCPRKGDASYYAFGPADGGDSRIVAWSYEAPFDHAPPMADYLCFDLAAFSKPACRRVIISRPAR